MQTRRLIIFMVIGMALIFGWNLFMNYLYSIHPEWKRPGQSQVVEAPASGPTSSPAALSAAPTTAPRGMDSRINAQTPEPAPAVQGQSVKGAEAARTVEIGSAAAKDKDYRMGLVLTSQGAGIERVVLNAFTQSVTNDARYDYQQPLTAENQVFVPLATRSVTIDGLSTDLSNVQWVVEPGADAQSSAFHVDITDAGGPVLRVRKLYTLSPRSDAGDMGYEVQVVEQLINLSDRALRVKTAINGPVAPVKELDTSDDRQLLAAYEGDGRVRIASHMFNAFSAQTPTLDLTREKDKANPLLWFGASSVYFNAIVRPLPLERGTVAPQYVANVEAFALNPAAKPEEHLVGMRMATAEFTLEPRSAQDVPLRVFFGPKMRAVLQSDYYGGYPIQYGLTLETLNSGCANYCTVGPLISGLVWLLRGFYFIFRDWGLAIIGLVVVVRLILHPITKKSQVNMAKMGKFGPEIERLKKKHGDNKEELNKAMMQFYKQHGFTPILGCLPMFLQMPIWIALWSALQNTFELRHADFLYGLTWIKDLSHPDRLLYFPEHGFSLLFLHIDALNVLPILMAVVFWLQQKVMPKPAAATKEQEQQQKMMQWMTLLFPLFLYTSPSGLNLYILTSTTIGIFESKRIRDHIKQREEAEKEGRVTVEARPTRAARRKDEKSTAVEGKKGGLTGWLADLQAKADQIKREADRKK